MLSLLIYANLAVGLVINQLSKSMLHICFSIILPFPNFKSFDYIICYCFSALGMQGVVSVLPFFIGYCI